MSLLLVFASAAVIIGLLSWGLIRTGRESGGREWALSWLVLLATGIAAPLSERWPPAIGLVMMGIVLFEGLLYLGTRRFAGLAHSRPVIAAIAAAAVAAAPVAVFTPRSVWIPISLAVVVIAPVAGAWLLWRTRTQRPAGYFDYVLGGSLFLPLVASGLSLLSTRTDYFSVDLYFVWFIMLVTLGGLQLGSLMNQISARSEVRRGALSALVRAVPVGLAISRSTGETSHVNPRFAELLGFADGEEAVGGAFERLFDRMLDRCVAEDVSAVRELAQSREARAIVRQGDGRIFDAQVLPVRRRSGAAAGRVLALRDITDERLFEEHRQRARQLETLGELAGGVAHDFNNKLTAILGNAVLVSESLPDESPLQADLSDLQHAAEYCASLTRDLLDFARATPRAPEPVELRPLIERVVREHREDLPPGVSLSLDVADDVGFVMADAGQLERVLSNLIANAGDAAASGARREVLIEAEAMHAEAELVEIRVSDDGPGIDASTRERIFDPFFTTKQPGDGTGLGLAIVFGLVKAHGGDVAVEDRSGGGTCFRVHWPRAQAPAVAREPSPAEAPPESETRGLHLLVVDDEEPIRRLAGRALERAGYRVTTAVDGAEGLRCFRELGSDVDAVVIDLTMPGMDGDDVLRAIWEDRPELPAVLMSGRLSDERLSALPTDLEALRKPFRPRELLRAIERVTGRDVAAGNAGDPLREAGRVS